MTGRRRKPRPPGNVRVFCTDEGRHPRVDLRTLQLYSDGERIRVRWDQRDGPAPETGLRSVDGLKTLEFRCPRCRRHLKVGEAAFVELARLIALQQQATGNTPIQVDLWVAERGVTSYP